MNESNKYTYIKGGIMQKWVPLFFLVLSIASFSSNETEVEKRREEQATFDDAIRTEEFERQIQQRKENKEEFINKVRSIRLEGNTVLEDFQINTFLQKYIGEQINLYSLIHTLENNYIEKGYITTRVRLDFERSDFEKGDISLFVVEGKIANVFFDGKENPWKRFVTFPQREGNLLNIRDLDQGMDTLADLSTMEIKPASKEGDSNIYITRKNKAVSGGIYYNDLGQKETGRHRLKYSLQFHDVLQGNESVELSYQMKVQRQDKEKNNENVSVNASLPFQNWLFQYGYNSTETLRTVPAHHKKYKATGRTEEQNFGIRRLLYRNTNHKIDMGVKLAIKEGKNYIDDIKLITGSRHLSVLSVDTSYMGRAFSGLLSSNLGVSFGLDKFGANVDAHEWYREEYTPKAQFRKYQVNLSWYRPIDSFYYKMNVGGQYSKDILYSQEKLSLGDDTTVRGFKDESIQGDKGFYIRNEIGYKGMKFLEPYLAYDYGRAFQNKIEKDRVATLQGVVLGLKFYCKYVEGNLAIARAVQKPSNFVKDDVVVYTSISYRF